MKVALVSDSISAYGGAERVIEQILAVYPQADVFAVVNVAPAEHQGFLGGRKVQTSFLQKLPGIRRLYRSLLPVWPLAVEQFDVTGYDLVITSHHSVAYGVLTRPDQPHISYVHSPMRYAWDLQHQYLEHSGLVRGPKSWMARRFLHSARIWDYCAAQRPDAIIANSHFVAERLWRTHRREAEVLHPPVAVEEIPQGGAQDTREHYLSVGRLVPYKRIELLARAFARMPQRHLKIVGTGPDMAKLQALGAPNVEVLGNLPTPEVRRLLGTARAFLFAGIEDFGIAPVEAQAAGTPVIAYRAGGLMETVRGAGTARQTGLFFDEQSEEAVIAAVEEFERVRHTIRPEDCRANAEDFSATQFRLKFKGAVDRALEDFARPIPKRLAPSVPEAPSGDTAQP